MNHLTHKKWAALYSTIALSCLLHLIFAHYPKLLIEEAYYWNYSQHLDIGYIDHPPMIALAIKLSTWLFGDSEFAVRFPAWCCWIIALFYNYRLSESMHPNTGWFACFLMCILPFGFIYSFFITPDSLLMALWSALLFYLYKALCLEQKKAWYAAGIVFGLGLLSKYSIGLLAVACFVYMVIVPQARTWFLRKEPYVAALIALIIFSPVIYWNATHEWISFAFQTTRRINEHSHTNLPNFFFFMFLFFTPTGLWGLFSLWNSKKHATTNIPPHAQQFMRVFSGVPLLVFCLFSLNHTLKFDWIGPCTLAIIPWLASLMHTHDRIWRLWRITAVILLSVYGVLLYCISAGLPKIENMSLVTNYGNWEQLTQHITRIAKQHEKNLVIIPLDSYGIASELVFYQKKHHQEYPLLGAHYFGCNSLMFDMWTQNVDLHDKKIMFIATQPALLNTVVSSHHMIALTDSQPVWPYENKKHELKSRYYYQIAEFH